MFNQKFHSSNFGIYLTKSNMSTLLVIYFIFLKLQWKFGIKSCVTNVQSGYSVSCFFRNFLKARFHLYCKGTTTQYGMSKISYTVLYFITESGDLILIIQELPTPFYSNKRNNHRVWHVKNIIHCSIFYHRKRRFNIDHTGVTHPFLLKQEEQPQSMTCQKTYIVQYFIIESEDLTLVIQELRTPFYSNKRNNHSMSNTTTQLNTFSWIVEI